jgi:hypothetical protein
VRVSRTSLVAADGTASARTFLAVRPDSPVDVQVIPSKNVALDGSDLDRLLLPPGGGWAELQFVVHALAPGPVRLKVLARQGRELLGSVTLDAEAVDPDAVAGGAQALTSAQVEVASASSPVLADVAWLEIAQIEADGQTRFRYELRLPGTDERITATSPPIHDADAFVAHLFREVQQLWFDNSDKPAKYLADLQDLGSSLFEQLFPQDLQAVLWQNRDNLDNLFLLADEPFVPWELVHLKPPIGPRQKAPRFLGQLGLVRWQFTPFPPEPRLQARAGKVFAVCPEYEDPTLDLSEVQAEAEYLSSTFGATAVTATEQKVRQLLRRRGGFDLLHFSGHGLADTATSPRRRSCSPVAPSAAPSSRTTSPPRPSRRTPVWETVRVLGRSLSSTPAKSGDRGSSSAVLAGSPGRSSRRAPPRSSRACGPSIRSQPAGSWRRSTAGCSTGTPSPTPP